MKSSILVAIAIVAPLSFSDAYAQGMRAQAEAAAAAYDRAAAQAKCPEVAACYRRHAQYNRCVAGSFSSGASSSCTKPPECGTCAASSGGSGGSSGGRASGGSGGGLGGLIPAANADSSDVDLGAPPSTFDTEGAIDQLVGEWKQQDQQRFDESMRKARETLGELMQALCRISVMAQNPPPACKVGVVIPPPLNATLGDRRASDRLTKNLPPEPVAEPPKREPKRKGDKGCYVRGVFRIKGIGWIASIPLDVGIEAQFTTATSDVLEIRNTTGMEAWAGINLLNVPVPVDAGVGGNPPVQITLPGKYLPKNQARPTSEIDLQLKYWTTNQKACAVGAVEPGYTTIEEWGPLYTGRPEEYQ